MVQVFGNRILGGIGAPESRAAEAFGAGVDTALSQRESRQAMIGEAQRQRMAEQEFAWRGEDREEAKRQRAAAAAAAAAARARNEAMVARYRDILGVPGGQPAVAGLTVPTAPAMARDRQGPAAAPAAARPAGVRAPASPALSFGTTVTGGGGAARMAGGAGTDVLRGGEGVDQLNAPAPVYRAPRAPDRSGGTSGTTYDMGPAFEGVRTFFGTTVNVGPTGEITTTPPAAAPAAPAAPAGAGAPPEVAVTLPGGEQLMLSTGQPQGVVPGMPVAPARLTFGPQLGAMPRTQEDVFVENLVAQTGAPLTGGPGGVPLPPRMGEPGAPNKVIRDLLAAREQQVQLAQAALEFNDMQTYNMAVAEIAKLDNGLGASVARLALNDIRYSNAPQRLNAIWTDLTGMQYEFVPTAPGVFDQFVDGNLYRSGVTIDEIEEATLMETDSGYAQRMMDLEQIRLEAEAQRTGQAAGAVVEYQGKAAVDLVKRLQEGLIDIDIEMAKREHGLSDDVVIGTDEASGIIYAMRGTDIVAQFRPVEEKDSKGNPFVRLEAIP